MAEVKKKFSELDPGSVPFEGTETLAAVQGGITKRATISGIHGAGWWDKLKAAFVDFVAPDALHANDADTIGGETSAELHNAGALTGTAPLTAIPSELTGKNAATATSAAKLTNARTITITGDATGSTTFDGSANKTITLDVTYATSAGSAGYATSAGTATNAGYATNADTVMGLGLSLSGSSPHNTLSCMIKDVTDANAIVGDGIMFSTVESSVNFPTVNYYAGIQFYIAGNPNYKIQIAHSVSYGGLYIRSSNNGAWLSWNKLWHSGNDGAGSGLAADTAATAGYATKAGTATNAGYATNATTAATCSGNAATATSAGSAPNSRCDGNLPTPNASNHGSFLFRDGDGLFYCARTGLNTFPYKWIKIAGD